MARNWLDELKDIEEICGGDVDLYIREMERVDHIEQYYDGNYKRYEQGTDKFGRDSVPWSVIQSYGNYLPKHQNFIENVIYWRLGFEPSDNIVIATSVHMRKEYDDFLKNNAMEWDEFKGRMDEHVKHIRNEFMQLNGWLDHLDLNEKDFCHYDEYEPAHKLAAR